MSHYKAEYIWLDGQQPTAKMRCKTRVLKTGETPPVWGFDGSSTEQAPGEASDCVLQPVFTCKDPIRGGSDILVLCEVMLTDMTPHPSNTRAALREIAAKTAHLEPWFGIEQEYTFFEGGRPLGWPANGFPAPQGGYYCGGGADEVVRQRGEPWGVGGGGGGGRRRWRRRWRWWWRRWRGGGGR